MVLQLCGEYVVSLKPFTNVKGFFFKNSPRILKIKTKVEDSERSKDQVETCGGCGMA
jgi:hypothetical protein